MKVRYHNNVDMYIGNIIRDHAIKISTVCPIM